MCTPKDKLVHNFCVPYIDDVMSYNSFTTSVNKNKLYGILNAQSVLLNREQQSCGPDAYRLGGVKLGIW